VKREIRSKVSIRSADVGGKPGVTLHAIRPGVVDDYGSLWAADAFDEAMSVRLPTLCWSHDWAEPLGPAVGYRSGADGPEIDFVFSDFDAVPMARRAHAQVGDGTIQDCSVGFSAAVKRAPTSDEVRQYPGITEVITRADLDEVSLVLRGAVPGAKVVSVRSSKVDFDAFLEVARRKAAGELTEDEARAAIELLGEAEAVGGNEPPVGGEVVPDAAAELADAEAMLDEAFESVGRSRLPDPIIRAWG
jgi:HK97 family phage prohead protease